MKQVFYIHGGESFMRHEDFLDRLNVMPLWHLEAAEKSKKWTSTLAEDLGPEYQAILPPMPNKQNAKFVEWSIWFERHFEHLHDGVILIGCSLGAMFLAKYLSYNSLPFRPSAVVLMAGAYALPDFAAVSCGDFLIAPKEVLIPYPTIVMHSKDDFVVPYVHGEALAAALPNAEFILFEDKNHFLIETFPEMVELIKKLAV